MIPSINHKMYQAIVSEMVGLRSENPRRLFLAGLQRRMAEAQQEMHQTKTLDTWLRAG